GFNERLDGLQAALLRVKLRHLDDWNEARRAKAAAYRSLLGDGIWTLTDRGSCVYHLFPVRVPGRDQLSRRLHGAGIETGVHYSPALHAQPALGGRHLRAGELPVAEAWAAE